LVCPQSYDNNLTGQRYKFQYHYSYWIVLQMFLALFLHHLQRSLMVRTELIANDIGEYEENFPFPKDYNENLTWRTFFSKKLNLKIICSHQFLDFYCVFTRLLGVRFTQHIFYVAWYQFMRLKKCLLSIHKKAYKFLSFFFDAD